MSDLTESEKHLSIPALDPQELMALPGKKALDVILESPMPARLIQSLAEEDFFWLVQDIGPEDALPILARATNDQWQYLLDIELWHKDRLANEAVSRWLDLLLKADLERFVTWGIHNNLDLIELHLFKNLEVRIREEEGSAEDFGEGFFSLDNIFFVRIKDDKNDVAIKQFLEGLAARDLEKYHHILLEMGGVLPAETEESLYRFRNARLAEKGFFPFEEAIGIYQYVSPQQLLGKDFQSVKHVRPRDMHQVVPVSSALYINDHGLFSAALKHIDNDLALEQIRIEFAALCNQILSADTLVVRDKTDLAAIVKKACGYLDIALGELSGADPQKTVALLDRFALKDVFRVGYGVVLRLKWKAEKWMGTSWFTNVGFGLDFWEEEWEAMLEGLLRKRPVMYTGVFDSSEPYRDFRNLDEIRQCSESLDEIMAADHLLSLVFANGPPRQSNGMYQTVTYKNLLLTHWARRHLELTREDPPLTNARLQSFFKDLWAGGIKPYVIEPTMKEGFIRWITARAGMAPQKVSAYLEKTLFGLLDELEKEYGSVSPEDLDARYIRHFLVML